MNIGMIEDVGDFAFRHIGGTRNIGGTAKLNRRIGKNPLEAVIRENGHMIPGLDPELYQCRRKGQCSVTPYSVTYRMKSPVGTTAGECWKFTPPGPRLRKKRGEVG
jgi:hypothetical protein